MRKDFVVLDFVRIPVSEKVEFSRSLSTKMKENPNFPTPDVSLDELESKADQLELRSVAALGGGKEAKVLMRQAEAELDKVLRKTARYVDRIADGDVAIILSAGFKQAKQPAPTVRPDFSVELGEKSGSVVLRRQAVDGAKSYIWQHCMGDTPATKDTDWVTAQVTSRATVEMTGLTPMSKYWFRSAVVSPSGTSAYNSPIMQAVI